MPRPSETITATVGSIVAAVLALLVAYGIDIPDGVGPAAVVIVSWIAAGVTWFIAAKQRAGELIAGKDGKVKS